MFENRRKSCHMCGNMRKDMTTCTVCPQSYCLRCADRIVNEHTLAVFNTGCPVCNLMCCCSSKSYTCSRINHCYRKCPTQKHLKLASDAMELAAETVQFCERIERNTPHAVASAHTRYHVVAASPNTSPPNNRPQQPSPFELALPVYIPQPVKRKPFTEKSHQQTLVYKKDENMPPKGRSCTTENIVPECTCSYGKRIKNNTPIHASHVYASGSSVRSSNDVFGENSNYWDDTEELKYMIQNNTPNNNNSSAATTTSTPMGNVVYRSLFTGHTDFPLWKAVLEEEEKVEFVYKPADVCRVQGGETVTHTVEAAEVCSSE